ncbi:MAG TPA: hypothetical protein VIN71_05695 [Pseudomonadales bacterium]
MPECTFDSDALQNELAARHASLFMICYRRRDISGIHISLTALTHVLNTLKLWPERQAVSRRLRSFILQQAFPEAELPALDWLLQHYFSDDPQDSSDETVMLPWYQSLDDEWVLRNKLRSLFPEHSNSQLTLLIAEQQRAAVDNGAADAG